MAALLLEKQQQQMELARQQQEQVRARGPHFFDAESAFLHHHRRVALELSHCADFFSLVSLLFFSCLINMSFSNFPSLAVVQDFVSQTFLS